MEYLGTMMKSLNQSSDVQEAFKRLRQVVESSKGLGDILKTEQNFPVDLANKSIGYVARLEGQILNSTSSKKSNDGRYSISFNLLFSSPF